MSSYSSLLSLSPVDGDDDGMAVAAAVSSYLSFDIDVSEEYYQLEAAATAFHPEQQAPEPHLALLQGTDDYKNVELARSGVGADESSKHSHLEVGVLSSDGLSSRDKIDRGSSTTAAGGGGERSKGRKIAFKTRSEVDVLEDGYRWRKYGKKMVKNSPNPRNYYRCSSEGCHVKKRVERERDDASFVVTTYDGVHNHPAPLPLPPRGCAGYSPAVGRPQGQRVEEEPQSVEGRCFLDLKPHAAGAGGLASQLDN